MGKSIKIFVSIFVLLLACLIAAGGFYFYRYNQPPSDWNEDFTILIEPGMSVSSIGRDLEESDVLSSYYVFRIYHEVLGRGNTIPTGSYTLNPDMTGIDVYKKLVSGEQDLITLTIPEGWTASMVAARFQESGVCSASDFLRVVRDGDFIESVGFNAPSLEGYLFPDTYRFVYGESAENVVRAMVGNLIVQLDRIYPDWRDLTEEQLKNKITMASIVEKEYRLPEEAPLIASVFYNRLDSPEFPKLQSCATVVYVITEVQGKPHPDRLLYRDLEIADPYNTYYAEGLPPGAIASPGYTALDAAFHPAQTNYVFFVVKDSNAGSHNFSSSYGDFLDNKDSYLESFRSK